MSTTSGSVSTVAKPLGEVAKRPQVDGLQPAAKVMSGKAKKKGPYANSLSESKKRVEEADLSEDDIILVPGQGRMRKSGFIKNDPDRAEHEGQTLKNSLHTIIRLATHLDKELSVRDSFPEWVSEKVGSVKTDMLSVMNYIISAQEMQHDPDAMESGGGVIAGGSVGYEESIEESHYDDDYEDCSWCSGSGEGQYDGSTCSHCHGSGVEPASDNDDDIDDIDYEDDADYDEPESHYEKSLRTRGLGEGAKVDRMVKHIAKSEKKLGHTKKEAENIAWATANKRGMLDNKNKKK